MAYSRSSIGEVIAEHYRDQRVLVTGHNGFVGSWLSYWLVRAGAHVVGLSLAAESDSMAEQIGLDEMVTGLEIDIRDSRAVSDVISRHRPDFVFHLAAQSLVRRSYKEPLETLSTNVLGTANVLEALRGSQVKSCVVVTSDKCYRTGTDAHVESDPLGGDDPYSASKAAAELVAHAYARSFFADGYPAIATARAGNIIGGGDRATDRLVPDFVRAAELGESLELRYPGAVRPWQHVLEASAGYLRLGAALARGQGDFAGAWNFGPATEAQATVRELVELLRSSWATQTQVLISEAEVVEAREPERELLMLDSSRAQGELGWLPLLDLKTTVDWTTAWYVAAQRGGRSAVLAELDSEIARYEAQDMVKIDAARSEVSTHSSRVSDVDARDGMERLDSTPCH